MRALLPPLLVGLLLLVTTRANPPLTIFGNEYVFSTFHYPTDPNAGKAHREEYARKYGPFGDYLVESLSYGHHGGHHGDSNAGYGPPPPPSSSGYGPPPAPSAGYGAAEVPTYEAAPGGGRPKRYPDLPPNFRKRDGLSKATAQSSSIGYWDGSPNDFRSADPPSHPSNFPLSSLFFDRSASSSSSDELYSDGS